MSTEQVHFVHAPNAPDSDPAETREWLDAFDAVLRQAGPERGHELFRRLAEHARLRQVNVQPALNTPYCNTIPHASQSAYPGDLQLERNIIALVRWNALAMVVRANKHSTELGGHLASYASSAELFEVGFNHFFRGNDPDLDTERTADLVFFQPHSAPGVYARAFLEGRLTAAHLNHYRRETSGKGLSSYPHPWLMPRFWQFPTGSMGLGPITAVYQARLMHYLRNRRLLDPADRKVWAFAGDGEMDEPESIAGLTLAARENLDNLIFVVNCNLQRLDGPVRGNGSIIQELERVFAGAGWNVIKLLWGSDWDDLFARDREGVILRRLHETVDGELQSYAANDALFNRERFFNKYEELRDLVAHMLDEQIDSLTRGGHDPIKIHAAFDAAVRHAGQPTVVLAQTKKGYGLGRWAEGRMSAHQQKKLDSEALRAFRDRYELPLSDEQVDHAEFYRPPADSPEIRYLHERRRILRGFVPVRVTKAHVLDAPRRQVFAEFVFKPEDREVSTTVAFVRMLSALLKNKELGPRIVPIVADEARTFGMESLFRNIGIYSHCGQLYEPEDQKHLLYYKESQDGQILEEGITEAGALSSWMAAATSYSHHAFPLIPFYIYYSIFGFQRVGDLIWAAGDSRARGFLLGATAGRTTLSGEGLQHQDGSSHLIAATVPNCRAYDPCFAFELAVILEHGLETMLERQQDVFYYVTLMNENYQHRVMPEGAEEGIVRGMYLVRPSTRAVPAAPRNGGTALPRLHKATRNAERRVQFLGSGTILREALAAAELLENDWDIAADVWSVTSFTELRREGMEVERANRVHPGRSSQSSWVERCLGSRPGPVIAASDYVRAVPDLIRTW
ncbi:MAG TPA: pyruvate dehydrogenase (acetyl-transferring), homodimeric type, partial [Terriglobales bacterium]|nr:pyruvate dehydrogenase (acetyl-transferring), homodimeric type [Terriglobales bacterium]